MVRKKKAKQNPIWAYLTNTVFNSHTLPLIFTISVLGIFFVLIRMKGVEQDYQYNDLAKKITLQKTENKELKAKRARELSVKNLKAYADKYELNEPDEKHVIIIP